MTEILRTHIEIAGRKRTAYEGQIWRGHRNAKPFLIAYGEPVFLGFGFRGKAVLHIQRLEDMFPDVPLIGLTTHLLNDHTQYYVIGIGILVTLTRRCTEFDVRQRSYVVFNRRIAQV